MDIARSLWVILYCEKAAYIEKIVHCFPFLYTSINNICFYFFTVLICYYFYDYILRIHILRVIVESESCNKILSYFPESAVFVIGDVFNRILCTLMWCIIHRCYCCC